MNLKNAAGFIKRESVLCAALALAAASSFAVPPDAAYAGYIDFRTLSILFCLMCVMEGFQTLALFRRIAVRLLGRVRSRRGIILVLMLLCFFFSMMITNDVALITFVPFAFTVLDLLGGQRRALILPVVAMQTVAANLGSMLTPIGNPQNLYLYGKAGLSIGAFIFLMLPYAALSLILLVLWAVAEGRAAEGKEVSAAPVQELPAPWTRRERALLALYLSLFAMCLLSVAHVMPWQAALACVIASALIFDRTLLLKADYPLLLTFAGFFIFIGNLGRIGPFRSFLFCAVSGREVWAAIAVSQLISNVPAAILLSGFTEEYGALIVGANLGGLGTLVASMASLISYKYVALREMRRRGEYVLIFTLANLAFLAPLSALSAFLGRAL